MADTNSVANRCSECQAFLPESDRMCDACRVALIDRRKIEAAMQRLDDVERCNREAMIRAGRDAELASQRAALAEERRVTEREQELALIARGQAPGRR
jgi:ribosomal protein L17